MIAGLSTSCADRNRKMDASSEPPSIGRPTLPRLTDEAEQIVGRAHAQDWPQVYRYIENINAAWLDFTRRATETEPQVIPLSPPAATLESRVTAALSALRDAAGKRDAAATAKTAMDLRKALADLSEYYQAAAPPDLQTLESLERQILVDLSSDGFASASAAFQSARDAWRRVEPEIQTRAGSGPTQAIADQFKAQRAAIEAHDRGAAMAGAETMLSLLETVRRHY